MQMIHLPYERDNENSLTLWKLAGYDVGWFID